jgi:predicted SPOUT superfamily RNA methylase MTH1
MIVNLISIALPDSMFLSDDTLRDKTVKLGEVARAAAIFAVERIYIYRDTSKNFDSSFELARTILEYEDTPQYLRKRLIGKRKELDFVGILPPLRTPSHLKNPTPRIGEYREGVVVSTNGVLMSDIGAKELGKLEGRGQEGQRLTFQVTSLDPLTVKAAHKPEGSYWGYEVRRAPSLSRFLRSANFDTIILTSRLGSPVTERWKEFCNKCNPDARILICFGSPDRGLDKFLNQDSAKVSDFEALYLNMFPSQQTETIRLEEALVGTLSIVNVALKFHKIE